MITTLWRSFEIVNSKMKVVVAKYFAKTPLVPPISLVKEDEKEYAKGSYISMKLCANPTDEHSPTHKIQVPYFKAGLCEKFLEFYDKRFKPSLLDNI